MQNAEQLENAYEALKDSAGSSFLEQQSYMDGLSGRINALKESLTGISMKMIDSDFLKGLIDNMTKGVDVTGEIIDTFGVMPTTIMGVVGAMTILNSKFRENSDVQLKLMFPGYSKTMDILQQIEQKLISYRNAQLKTIEVNKIFASGIQGSSVSLQGLSLELVKSQGKMILATAGLVSMKIATIALQTALSTGLSLAISGCISLITKWIGSIETAEKKAQKMSEASQNMATAMSEYSDNSKLLSDYAKIKKQIDDISTTEKERNALNQELSSIKSQLANMDSQAYAILNNQNIPLERQLELLKHINDEKMREKALELESAMGKQSEADAMVKDVQIYTNTIRDLQDALSKGDGQGIAKILGVGKDFDDAKQAIDDYKTKIENLMTDIDIWNSNVKMLKDNNLGAELSYVKLGDSINDMLNSILGASDNINELSNGIDESGQSANDAADALATIQSSLEGAEMSTESATNIMNAFTQAIESGISPAEALANALNSINMQSNLQEATKTYAECIEEVGNLHSIMKELNEEQGLTPAIVAKVASAYPEVGASVTNVASLQDFLQDKINETMQRQAEACAVMIENDTQYYASKVANNAEFEQLLNDSIASIVGMHAEGYDIDLSNFSTLAELKNAIQNQFGEAQGVSINGILDMYNQAYTFDSQNFADLNAMKQGYINQLIPAIANWISSFTGGNAEGYTADLANFNNLAEMKAYAISQLSQKMADLQSEWTKVINSYNDAVQEAYANGNDNKTLELESQALRKVKPINEQINTISAQLSLIDKVFSGLEAQLNTYESTFTGATFGGNIGKGGSGAKKPSGSKGSGSGGSKGDKDKEVEDLIVKIDRYKDLNSKIQQITNDIEKNRALQKTASEEQLAELVKEEQELLEKQKNAYENLKNELKKEQEELKTHLGANWFEFDADGNISNYEDALKKLEDWANAASGEEKERRKKVVEDLIVNVDRYYDLINDEISDADKTIINTSNEIYDIIMKQELDKIEAIKNASDAMFDAIKRKFDELDYQKNVDGDSNADKTNNYYIKKLALIREQIKQAEDDLNKYNAELSSAVTDEAKTEILANIKETEDGLLSYKDMLQSTREEYQKWIIEMTQTPYRDKVWQLGTQQMNKIVYELEVIGETDATKKLQLMAQQMEIQKGLADEAKKNYENLIHIRDNAELTADAQQALTESLKKAEEQMHNANMELHQFREEYQKYLLQVTQSPYKDKVWQLGTQQMNKIVYELEVIGEGDATRKLQLMANQLEIQKNLTDEAKKNYENLIHIRDNVELTADAYQELIKQLMSAEEEMHNQSMALHQLKEEYEKYLLQTMYTPYRDKMWQLGTQQMNKIEYKLEILDEDDTVGKMELLEEKLSLQQQMVDETQKYFDQLVYTRDNVELTADAYQELIKQMMSAQETMHDQSMALQQIKKQMEDMAKSAIKDYVGQLKELEKLQMKQRHEEEINALGSMFFKVSEEEYNRYKKTRIDAINAEIEALEKKLALDSDNLALQQQLKGLQVELYDLQNENYANIEDWCKLSEDIHNANIAAIDKELEALEKQNELEKEREERLKRQNELLEAQQKIENIKKNKNIRQLKKTANGEWNFEYTHDEKELADANKDYKDKLESLNKWEAELEKDKYKKKLEELKQHEKESLETLKEMYNKHLEELNKKHEAEEEALDQKYDDMLEDTDKYLEELKTLYGDNWAEIMKALSKKLDDGKEDLTEFKKHTITEANEATKALNALMSYMNKIDGTTITLFQEIKPVEPSKAMSSRMVNLDACNITPSNAGGDTNNYNIQASFPNATSSDEIEKALLNIDRVAKQRVKNK